MEHDECEVVLREPRRRRAASSQGNWGPLQSREHVTSAGRVQKTREGRDGRAGHSTHEYNSRAEHKRVAQLRGRAGPYCRR